MINNFKFKTSAVIRLWLPDIFFEFPTRKFINNVSVAIASDVHLFLRRTLIYENYSYVQVPFLYSFRIFFNFFLSFRAWNSVGKLHIYLTLEIGERIPSYWDLFACLLQFWVKTVDVALGYKIQENKVVGDSSLFIRNR